MGNLEERRTMQQPHTALTLGKIHRNGATCIKRHLRLVGQGHLANLPGTAVVRP